MSSIGGSERNALSTLVATTASVRPTAVRPSTAPYDKGHIHTYVCVTDRPSYKHWTIVQTIGTIVQTYRFSLRMEIDWISCHKQNIEGAQTLFTRI